MMIASNNIEIPQYTYDYERNDNIFDILWEKMF